jgi:hypothetical protein
LNSLQESKNFPAMEQTALEVERLVKDQVANGRALASKVDGNALPQNSI